MSTTALAPSARLRAGQAPRPKHASERRGLCRNHDRASCQVRSTNYDARSRGSRFLEVDPVEGGSASDYDYVSGDPVNGFDLNGEAQCSDTSPGNKVLATFSARMPGRKGYSNVKLMCGYATRGWKHIKAGGHFGGKWGPWPYAFISMVLQSRKSQVVDEYNKRTGHTYRVFRLGIAHSGTGENLGILRVVIDLQTMTMVTAFFQTKSVDRRQW